MGLSVTVRKGDYIAVGDVLIRAKYVREKGFIRIWIDAADDVVIARLKDTEEKPVEWVRENLNTLIRKAKTTEPKGS